VTKSQHRPRLWDTQTLLTGLAAGFLVLAGSLLIAVAIYAGNGLGPTASVPEWIEALATLAAFMAAVVAASYAARVYLIERDRDDRWEAQQIRSQALLVAAWASSSQPEMVFDRRPSGVAQLWNGVGGCRVLLRNASDVPVTRVTVTVEIVVLNDPAKPEERHFLVGHQERLLPPAVDPVPINLVALEGDKVDVTSRGLVAFNDANYWAEVDLHFIDAGGRGWHRTPRGELFPS